jgi:hypothetical protein
VYCPGSELKTPGRNAESMKWAVTTRRNVYVVLDRHTHNTFNGTTVLL